MHERWPRPPLTAYLGKGGLGWIQVTAALVPCTDELPVSRDSCVSQGDGAARALVFITGAGAPLPILGSPSPGIPRKMRWYDEMVRTAGNVLRIGPLGAMTGRGK